MRSMAQRDPQLFPNGFMEGDMYVRYSFPEYIVYFQVRDGRLVNHDPATFTEESLKSSGLSQ